MHVVEFGPGQWRGPAGDAFRNIFAVAFCRGLGTCRPVSVPLDDAVGTYCTCLPATILLYCCTVAGCVVPEDPGGTAGTLFMTPDDMRPSCGPAFSHPYPAAIRLASLVEPLHEKRRVTRSHARHVPRRPATHLTRHMYRDGMGWDGMGCAALSHSSAPPDGWGGTVCILYCIV